MWPSHAHVRATAGVYNGTAEPVEAPLLKFFASYILAASPSEICMMDLASSAPSVSPHSAAFSKHKEPKYTRRNTIILIMEPPKTTRVLENPDMYDFIFIRAPKVPPPHHHLAPAPARPPELGARPLPWQRLLGGSRMITIMQASRLYLYIS